MLDVDQSPGIEEWHGVVGMGDDIPYILLHLFKLMSYFVVLGNIGFIRDHYRVFSDCRALEFYGQELRVWVACI